jgi:uncharacterized protein
MAAAVGTPVAALARVEKSDEWANPVPIGMMAVALTTMLVGLTNLPAPFGNGFAGGWPIFGMAVALGGGAQFFAGVISLRTGDMFHGLGFVSFGAFWIAFTLMMNVYSPSTGAATLQYGLAGFTGVWMLFTFALMINAPKFGWGTTVSVVLLFLVFALLTVKYCQLGSGATISSGESWAIGCEILATGVSFWYVGMARLTNWNYRRKVLPL